MSLTELEPADHMVMAITMAMAMVMEVKKRYKLNCWLELLNL